MQYILQEAAGTKPLSSHNIAQLFGVEEIDDPVLRRRGVRAGQQHRHHAGPQRRFFHLGPAGHRAPDLSGSGPRALPQRRALQSGAGQDHGHVGRHGQSPELRSFLHGGVYLSGFGKAPEVLHYVSPEQLRGDPVDGRSNIFSLGAILYEMATETKAFPGDDADQVRQAIVEVTPAAPIEVNRKIHPVLSEVIMKALSKAPEERYQSGQELVNDLERCKESATKAVAKKPAQPAQGLNAPPAPKARGCSPHSRAEVQRGAGNAPPESRPAAARPSRASRAYAACARSCHRSGKSRRRGCGMGKCERGFHRAAGEAAESRRSPAKASAQSTFQERASAVG